MEHATEFPEPPPAAAQYRITVCMTCDYPLQGLEVTANCPECGTPVAHSLRGHQLAFANRRYVRTLRNGLRLTVWGLMFLYFTVISAYLGAFFFRSYNYAQYVLAGSCALVAIVAALCGTWLATRPDPAAPRPGPQYTTQRITRLAVLIPIVAFLLKVASLLIEAAITAVPVPVQDGFHFIADVINRGVGTIIKLSLGVAIFCFLRYTRILAERIPDANLIRGCMLYQWLLPIMARTVFWMPTFLSDDSRPYLVLRLLPISSVALACSFPRLLNKHIHSILATGQPAKLFFSGKTRSIAPVPAPPNQI